jgi:hypothetical protein
VQNLKAVLPIVVSREPWAKVTEVSLVHWVNADPPILATEAGISIEVSSVQPEKALVPMRVSPGFKTTDLSAEQYWKALPNVVMEAGISTEMRAL